jgi:hypothetical protein
MLERFKERTESGGIVIHAGGLDGNDYTLCGYAEEGHAMGSEDTSLEPVTRGKVSCENCIAIIRFGKKFPARLLAS